MPTPATAAATRRVYHYTLTLQGHLFLSETHPKVPVTSYRDPRFLDFFFRNVRLNTAAQFDVRQWEEGYYYVSPCAGEWNFLRVEGWTEPAERESPWIALELAAAGAAATGQEHQYVLKYPGTRLAPFQPSALQFHQHTGRLYHPAPVAMRNLPPSVPVTHGSDVSEQLLRLGCPPVPRPAWSLLRSEIMEALVDKITILDGDHGILAWQQQQYKVPYLSS
ncbi:hypothetical protein RI367_004067 [Sorochytrium milnesiophthora]